MLIYNSENKDIEGLITEQERVLTEPKIEMDKVIKSLLVLFRKWDGLLDKPQISRDIFLGSLRRMKFSYENLKKIETASNGFDKREAFSIVFFHSAKVFLEVVKKNFDKILRSEENSEVYKDITAIRNYFMHSYEKDFLDQKAIVRLDFNHIFNKKLYKLELFDFDNSKRMFNIYYSLDIFYYKIKQIALAAQVNIEEKLKKK